MADEFTTSIDQMSMIYAGEIRKDDDNLKKDDIKDDVTIHLVIRVPKSDTASTTFASLTTQPEIMSNPQIREWMERNPEISHLLNNPDLL
ncbi:unnamed protein product [Rotaria magnacalcarata]|nr:unnamed protein product [Rotaria magnacalcarata]CAF2273923.1 unnamed protein product [Rotaria magnacalcarata]